MPGATIYRSKPAALTSGHGYGAGRDLLGMASPGEAHRPPKGSKRALTQLERPLARVIYD